VHYFHTHFNVYPNPQGKVDCGYHQAATHISECELGVSHDVGDKLGGGEDVQHQVHTNESGAGADVREAEQHSQRHHEVQAVLKVGPLIAPIQGLTVAHPKHSVVSQVCDVPEQQQGSIVVVDQDILVRF